MTRFELVDKHFNKIFETKRNFNMKKLQILSSTDAPLHNKQMLSSITEADLDEQKLKFHQFTTVKFFEENPYHRGFLINHKMGQGKTRLAVAVADQYIRRFSDRRVVILSAKSLAENFKKEVELYCTSRGNNSDLKNYSFVSLNSSNMFNKMMDSDLEERFGEFITYEKSLENIMLIVDEAHNLFNAITNGSKNAVSLYDKIMETKNIRLLFMSGTPCINHPFELVPCYNMLYGEIDVRTVGGDDAESDLFIGGGTGGIIDWCSIDYSGPIYEIIKRKENNENNENMVGGFNKKDSRDVTIEKVTLFPEDIDEFVNYFIDTVNLTIKNKDKFIDRIYGLTSYYGDLFIEDGQKGFPEQLETKIIRIPMSTDQYAAYSTARDAERGESKAVYKSSSARFSSASSASSTYRVKSRQISNYSIPEHALGPVRGAKSREKFIDNLTFDDLKNPNNSPKMSTIFNNLMKHILRDEPGLVYSQFVSGEGIRIFSRILDVNEWQQYKITSQATSDKSHPSYAILSGEIDPVDRAAIIRIFNEGSINLLLLSGAVAEGIDLKGVRHIHIMEPFWNYSRINQVITRGVRYMSHEHLPEDQRNVQPYVYLSDYPTFVSVGSIKEPTTDVDLYTKSIANMKLINILPL
jgi:superfamily II DNA or RNA helicase